MDCFHDFCLACDRESVAGPYCSQACRLADLEKGRPATSTSPVLRPSSSSQHRSSSWTSSPTPSSSADRYAARSPRQLTEERRMSKLSYFPTSPTSSTESNAQVSEPHHQRSLTPSSSWSSLSSTASSSSAQGISVQAKIELQQYFSSFDKVRASKRRQGSW